MIQKSPSEKVWAFFLFFEKFIWECSLVGGATDCCDKWQLSLVIMIEKSSEFRER